MGRVNPGKLISLFPEMEGYDIEGIFPIGYPSAQPAGQPSGKHSQRKEISEVFTTI